MTSVDQRWLTWCEAALLGPDTIGLIGIGATEQHGPHLPLSTDTVITELLLRECAERIEGAILIAPVIPVGLSDHHIGFAGTISVTAETLTALLDAYLHSFLRMGIHRVGIISGHGGNFAFLSTYARECVARFESLHLAAYDRFSELVAVASTAIRDVGGLPPETDVHAGCIETSIGLHAFPERVREFADVHGYTRAEPGWLERVFGGVEALSPSGVIGDPATSSARAGAAIVAAMANEFARWLAAEFDYPQVARSL